MDKQKINYSIKDIKKPQELIEVYNNEPEPVFYWRGIEDTAFGFVFGPSKVGKTIFCENFAMSLAIGRDVFFDSEMIGTPKKVFIVALEEDYRNRTRRMKKQMTKLTNKEIDLFNSNLILAGKNFPRFLTSSKQWKKFEVLLEDIKPEVVIIDSLTRILNADITNREVCKAILARLRNFAYENNLCLIVIHHATKNFGKPLTMDSMAGSSVMSQEADFSLGLNSNQITNEKYFKEVFYRYKESNKMVNYYGICNDSNWLISGDLTHESKIISDMGDYSANYYEMIIRYLEDKGMELFIDDDSLESYNIKVAELKEEFVSTNIMPLRSFDYTLKNVVKNGVLFSNGAKGNYVYKL